MLRLSGRAIFMAAFAMIHALCASQAQAQCRGGGGGMQQQMMRSGGMHQNMMRAGGMNQNMMRAGGMNQNMMRAGGGMNQSNMQTAQLQQQVQLLSAMLQEQQSVMLAAASRERQLQTTMKAGPVRQPKNELVANREPVDPQVAALQEQNLLLEEELRNQKQKNRRLQAQMKEKPRAAEPKVVNLATKN